MTFTQLLPTLLLVALALIMFGLGLSLSTQDFRRAAGHPGAIGIALLLQLLVMPALAYLLAVSFGLGPVYAVGLMVLAATPGGVSANLFSHLFRGNVAMNITLTAITTVISVVSLPLISNMAIGLFAQSSQIVPMQLRKVAEVITIVLIPVVIGMVVAKYRPSFASAMEKPFKIFSGVILALFAVIALVKEWDAVTSNFSSVGPAVILFNLACLLLGYYGSRLAGLQDDMAAAISFETGIHNSTLAIYVAISVLGDIRIAVPAAIYSFSMYVTATAFGMLVLNRRKRSQALAGSTQ
jgi:BASS family bile acid:Na+ symporter